MSNVLRDGPDEPAETSPQPLEKELRDAAPSTEGGLNRTLGLNKVFAALKVAAPKPLQIGRFVLAEAIGHGGMGTVYRARDPQLNRDVAIKLLHREVLNSDTDLIRDEAKALARLAHPNVVTVYDLGVAQGQLYVAMQYVDGSDLRRWVVSGQRPPWRDVVRRFIEAGRGLAAAHAAGVIHRDFKPENVLIGADGSVRLADFGLARRSDGQAAPAELAGTYDYMAPEILIGQPAGQRSDQYSFCASVRKMLEHGPTSEDNEAAAVRQTLARGLLPDPKERWPSMEVLLGALEQALDQGPADRRRALLLERVEQHWIDGVMRTSVSGRSALALPMADAREHVELPWPASTSKEQRGVQSTDDLLTQLDIGNGSLLILGGPGAGKTTAMLMLAESLARNARLVRRAPAPVVANLSTFGLDARPLPAWLADEISTKYSLPRAAVARWIENDELALLLDGVDEVRANRRDLCIDALNDFRAHHSCPLVVVSRTEDYAAAGAKLKLGAAVEIRPLTAAMVAALIGQDRAGESMLIDDAQSEHLRTPLMLSLAVGDGASFKPSLDSAYDAYLQRVRSRHDIDPNDARRFESALSWLARALQREESSEIWVERLSIRWFQSRLQSWIATALCYLTMLALCAASLTLVTAVVENDAASGAALGLCCGVFLLIFNRGVEVKPVGRLRWTWSRAGRWLPVSLAIGMILGAAYGLLYIVWVNVVFGGALGVICAVSIGLEPAWDESPVRVNYGIVQSAINAAVLGVSGGLFGGLLLGYVLLPFMLPHVGPESSFVALENPRFSVFAIGEAASGLSIAMIHGGTAVVLHVVLRALLVLFSPLPANLAAFLDHGVQRALLRRVGGGYIFLHRTFLEYLATQRRTD